MCSQKAWLGQVVESLRLSPLFHFSLASKELFHSNFLAWLCETYPKHVGKFFALFVNDPPSSFDRVDAYRELRHVDLTFKYENGEQLLIENKVKSLPSREQLQAIAGAVRKKDRAKTSFLLLSLSRPSFLPADEKIIQLDDQVAWRHITYRQLGDALRQFVPSIVAANGYHGSLLKDYVDFIVNLDDLQSRSAIDWDDEARDFFIAKSDMEQLRSVRLHDLVDKRRYEQLAQRVGAALCQEHFPVIHGTIVPLLARVQDGQVLVDAGMTHATGIFDLKYVVSNRERYGAPVVLGVQLQANMFRLYLEMWDKRRAKTAAYALWEPRGRDRLWYNFGLVHGDSEEYPKGEGPFNQYSGIFFYRYKRLGHTSPQRLVETIVANARLIRDNEAAIRQQLDQAL